MKVLNFGSLNLDYIYGLDHIVKPGETEHSKSLETICGGKGLNQSIALARSGSNVYHAGNVGAKDGAMLLDKMMSAGVDTQFVRKHNEPSGHALIQVDKQGQNSIILFGGANQKVDVAQIDSTLDFFNKGDVIVLQNEINLLETIIRKAHEKQLKIALNPSPFVESLCDLPLSWIDYLFVNEIEAESLLACDDADNIIDYSEQHQGMLIVMTLGSEGVDVIQNGVVQHVDAYSVKPKDTTAAGDTFTGYFLSAHLSGRSLIESAKQATKASAICVCREGASDSIPTMDELNTFEF